MDPEKVHFGLRGLLQYHISDLESPRVTVESEIICNISSFFVLLPGEFTKPKILLGVVSGS